MPAPCRVECTAPHRTRTALCARVALGTAPGGCQDLSAGCLGGQDTPGCKPAAVPQFCWPASGAAESHCSITPKRSQPRAGSLPPSSSSSHMAYPRFGAVGKGPSWQDQLLHTVCSSPGRTDPRGCPRHFSFRLSLPCPAVPCRSPSRGAPRAAGRCRQPARRGTRSPPRSQLGASAWSLRAGPGTFPTMPPVRPAAQPAGPPCRVGPTAGAAAEFAPYLWVLLTSHAPPRQREQD